jgi:hypothetical protein
MGTQQSRSGHGRQGSRQPSQQSDRRPEQDRDLQRVKQGDRGEQQRSGGADRQPDQRQEVQQSQLGGGRDYEHKLENEGREQNRLQQAQRQQTSQQNAQGTPQAPRASGGLDALRGGGEHGEGSYAGTRQYDQATKRFAESGRVEEAARAAAPKSPAEAREMEAAEAEGKRHAKGEDPALTRGAPSASRGTHGEK